MNRLVRKHESARKSVPQPVIQYREGAEVGILAYGSTDAAIQECQDQLRAEYGLETHYLRIRALPLTVHLKEFVNRCERVYVVEQNRDGQMADLVKLEIGAEQVKIRKVLHYTGWPIDARFITDAVLAQEQEGEP
jgi:2-oxoglutarate ferredoxin oxidoreductase subunit alpha